MGFSNKIITIMLFSVVLSACDNSNLTVNNKYKNTISDKTSNQCVVGNFQLIKAKDDTAVYIFMDNLRFPISSWGWVDRCAKNVNINVISLEKLNLIELGEITYN